MTRADFVPITRATRSGSSSVRVLVKLSRWVAISKAPPGIDAVPWETRATSEKRYKMSMAAMLGGMAYGKESAGAAHAMSQSAGGVHDVPHGALTARVLGPVMLAGILISQLLSDERRVARAESDERRVTNYE